MVHLTSKSDRWNEMTQRLMRAVSWRKNRRRRNKNKIKKNKMNNHDSEDASLYKKLLRLHYMRNCIFFKFEKFYIALKKI